MTARHTTSFALVVSLLATAALGCHVFDEISEHYFADENDGLAGRWVPEWLGVDSARNIHVAIDADGSQIWLRFEYERLGNTLPCSGPHELGQRDRPVGRYQPAWWPECLTRRRGPCTDSWQNDVMICETTIESRSGVERDYRSYFVVDRKNKTMYFWDQGF